MTREEILQTFSDINYAYNNSTKYDTLKHMLDELTEPCEDCISRQQAIDKMQELEDEDDEMYGCSIPEGFDGKRAIEALKTLPSVQPKPKTKTEETEGSGIKYLNINVSNSEVERNPDIVRLCSDIGILEYVKKGTEGGKDEKIL